MPRRTLIVVALAAGACQPLDETAQAGAGSAATLDTRTSADRAPPINPFFASMGGVAPDCVQDADRERKRDACAAVLETETHPAKRAAALNNLGVAMSPPDSDPACHQLIRDKTSGSAMGRAVGCMIRGEYLPAGQASKFINALSDYPVESDGDRSTYWRLRNGEYERASPWEPHHNLGVALMHQHEYRGALRALSVALDRAPNQPKVLATIEEARVRSKSTPFMAPRGVEHIYIIDNPYQSNNNFYIWFPTGHNDYFSVKSREIDAATTEGPDAAWAYYYRGLLMEMMARPDEAVESWMIAIEMEPETELPRWAAILAANGLDAGPGEDGLERALLACAVDPDC